MSVALKTAAADDVWITPLEALNPASPPRFQNDTIWPVFERLRREDPVHLTEESEFGRYWSITKWEVRSMARRSMSQPLRSFSLSFLAIPTSTR